MQWLSMTERGHRIKLGMTDIIYNIGLIVGWLISVDSSVPSVVVHSVGLVVALLLAVLVYFSVKQD